MSVDRTFLLSAYLIRGAQRLTYHVNIRMLLLHWFLLHHRGIRFRCHLLRSDPDLPHDTIFHLTNPI